MPAPATRPRFQPRLNPSGRYSPCNAAIARCASPWISAASSRVTAPKSPTWRVGATIRCPDAYGNLFSSTSATTPRWITISSGASQKMHPGVSSDCSMYSSRHGAHNGFGMARFYQTPLPIFSPAWFPRRRPARLEPALVPEEREQPEERDDHPGEDHPERPDRVVARETNVHPEEAGDEREREEDHAEDRQQPQDVVLAVREHRLVRVLERLDDLLVVVEVVPHALRRVDDVVEVELELLGQEP